MDSEVADLSVVSHQANTEKEPDKSKLNKSKSKGKGKQGKNRLGYASDGFPENRLSKGKSQRRSYVTPFPV